MLSCASSARAVTDDAFSPVPRLRLVANNIIRVRLSELKLNGFVSENGSRNMVTESSAMARSLVSSVTRAGGGDCTVSVTSLLVAVPKEFVTTQRNFAPLSAAVVTGVVYIGALAPLMFDWFLCHW